MGWWVAFSPKYEMTCARGPSSLWCGMHTGGKISMFNMLMKAFTSSKTLEEKSFPMDIKHLPSVASAAHWRVWAYASIQSWVSHPHLLTSSLRNCPNNQNGWGGWTDQGPRSFNHPAPCGQQPPHESICGHITSMCQRVDQLPPLFLHPLPSLHTAQATSLSSTGVGLLQGKRWHPLAWRCGCLVCTSIFHLI